MGTKFSTRIWVGVVGIASIFWGSKDMRILWFR